MKTFEPQYNIIALILCKNVFKRVYKHCPQCVKKAVICPPLNVYRRWIKAHASTSCHTEPNTPVSVVNDKAAQQPISYQLMVLLYIGNFCCHSTIWKKSTYYTTGYQSTSQSLSSEVFLCMIICRIMPAKTPAKWTFLEHLGPLLLI